jgi:hypothetical protein
VADERLLERVDGRGQWLVEAELNLRFDGRVSAGDGAA